VLLRDRGDTFGPAFDRAAQVVGAVQITATIAAIEKAYSAGP
jgi:hypothetical protein